METVLHFGPVFKGKKLVILITSNVCALGLPKALQMKKSSRSSNGQLSVQIISVKKKCAACFCLETFVSPALNRALINECRKSVCVLATTFSLSSLSVHFFPFPAEPVFCEF